MGKVKVLTTDYFQENLLDRYSCWKSIYENGCSDSTWEDGVNLNLVRNHILYFRGLCESTFGTKYWMYPDAYFFPLPPQFPNAFMATSRELRCKGKVLESTKIYSYQEIMQFERTKS